MSITTGVDLSGSIPSSTGGLMEAINHFLNQHIAGIAMMAMCVIHSIQKRRTNGNEGQQTQTKGVNKHEAGRANHRISTEEQTTKGVN